MGISSKSKLCSGNFKNLNFGKYVLHHVDFKREGKETSLRTQTYLRLSLVSAENNVCVRRLKRNRAKNYFSDQSKLLIATSEVIVTKGRNDVLENYFSSKLKNNCTIVFFLVHETPQHPFNVVTGSCSNLGQSK